MYRATRNEMNINFNEKMYFVKEKMIIKVATKNTIQ